MYSFSATCHVLAVVNVMHRVRIPLFSRPYTVGARISLSRGGVYCFILCTVKAAIHCPLCLLSSCVLRAISPLFSPVSCAQFSAQLDASAWVHPRCRSTRTLMVLSAVRTSSPPSQGSWENVPSSVVFCFASCISRHVSFSSASHWVMLCARSGSESHTCAYVCDTTYAQDI